MPDTPKRHHNNIKTSKKTKKHHLAMFKNNPLFFINVLFCSTYIFCFWRAVFFWKYYKQMFSAKHSFSKTQLVKPTFSPMSKKTPFFPKKVSFLVLGDFRWNHYFIVFPGLHCLGQKIFCPKQIVCTKMRVFLPSRHKQRQAIFAKKIHFFDFSHFCMTTFKKIFLWGLLVFSIFFFYFFLFLFLQHKKDKNKKCYFLFENLNFDIPKILQKHYFGTVWHYLSFQRNTQKTV